MVPDNELLQKHVKEGSDAAFTELVQRHLALVYSTALRQLGGDAPAQDVAQTVFTALAQGGLALGSNGARRLALSRHASRRCAVRAIESPTDNARTGGTRHE